MSRESFATGDFKFIFFVFAFASRLLLVPLPFYYALQVCQVKKKNTLVYTPPIHYLTRKQM